MEGEKCYIHSMQRGKGQPSASSAYRRRRNGDSEKEGHSGAGGAHRPALTLAGTPNATPCAWARWGWVAQLYSQALTFPRIS